MIMYKVGDRVKFTFLGEVLYGEIIEKVDRLKWKVKSDEGTTYPFVHAKEPVVKRETKADKVLSIIIEKL